jgi:hypothetical protein
MMRITVTRKPATKARMCINPFTREQVMFKAKLARNVVRGVRCGASKTCSDRHQQDAAVARATQALAPVPVTFWPCSVPVSASLHSRLRSRLRTS